MTISQNKTINRLVKYGIVGAISNVLLYFLYLIMTFFGIPPVVATTVAFVTGIIGTFFANRNWSFTSEVSIGRGSAKYVVAYCLGYIGQVGTLLLLTSNFSLPHQFAQLVGMGIAAIIIFTMLQLWVFKE